MSNDDDINNVRNKFYREFNSMIRKFHFTESQIKLYLFKHYCLQLYGAELWFGSKGSSGSIKQFAIGYHKAIKKILNLSYHESNHYACQESNLFTFEHLTNKIKIITGRKIIDEPCDFIYKATDYMVISSVMLQDIYENTM